MLKFLLLTQIYMTDGSYYFQNDTVLVPTESACHEFALEVIDDALEHLDTSVRASIRQTGHSCTDETVELSFWPIPKKVPIPKRLVR
jgi:hypothetical protein